MAHMRQQVDGHPSLKRQGPEPGFGFRNASAALQGMETLTLGRASNSPNKSYLHTFGPKAGIFYTLGAIG